MFNWKMTARSSMARRKRRPAQRGWGLTRSRKGQELDDQTTRPLEKLPLP